MKKLIPYCISAIIGVSCIGYRVQNTFSEQITLDKNIEKKVDSKIEVLQETKVEVVTLTENRNTAIFSRGGNYEGYRKVVNKTVEVLDWWSEVKAIFPREGIATVTDVYSGIQFNIVRTMGDNHADCETLTIEDTQKMKEVFGGFNWQKRPVIISVNGRNVAASMAGMPHAGSDAAPAFASTSNRSDGYGSGENLDVIKGNDMDGHFDVHFLNSRRHGDGRITDTVDETHQQNIRIASGYKIP
ncbi:MAG: hypothetical protein AB6733_22790 [Clostridiaceae bacterium]